VGGILAIFSDSASIYYVFYQVFTFKGFNCAFFIHVAHF